MGKIEANLRNAIQSKKDIKAALHLLDDSHNIGDFSTYAEWIISYLQKKGEQPEPGPEPEKEVYYYIQAIATDGGSVTGSGEYKKGDVLNIEAQANDGYHFDHWNSYRYGENYELPINVTESDIFTAIFEQDTPVPPQTYTVTVDIIGQGAVSGTGTFAAGSSTTLVATASTGYQFKQWGDGSTNPSKTITVNNDITFTAEFELIPTYTVTVNITGQGTVSGTGTFTAGSSTTLVATASTGYQFKQWSDGSTNPSKTITVDNDITLTVEFEQIPVAMWYYRTSGNVSWNLNDYELQTESDILFGPNIIDRYTIILAPEDKIVTLKLQLGIGDLNPVILDDRTTTAKEQGLITPELDAQGYKCYIYKENSKPTTQKSEIIIE